MERIPNDEMIGYLNEVLTKMKESDAVDMTDLQMIVNVSAVALARLVEDKYLTIINNGGVVKGEPLRGFKKEKEDGSDTREESKEEGN